MFSQGTFDKYAIQAWSILKVHFATLPYDDALSLIRSLLLKGVVSASEAIQLHDSVPIRERDASSLNYEYTLYALLPVLLERLDVNAARIYFKKTVSKYAIANSNAGFSGDRAAIVLGADQNIYSSAKLVCDKMSLPQSIAWSSRMLIEAHTADGLQYSHKYVGREISGPGHSQIGNQYSYQDNAWLLKVIVPLLEVHLSKLPTIALKNLLSRVPRSISLLHPTFRIRATVLALPALCLGDIAAELIELCEIRQSIPSIADAVATRAMENDTLARAYLEWAWTKQKMLYQPDEAKLLHMLVAMKKHSKFAKELATRIVTSEEFSKVEPLQLAFFNQLTWASQDRRFALSLVTDALSFGYRPEQWDSQYIVRLLKEIIVDDGLKAEVFANAELGPYLPEAVSAEDFRDSENALRLFTNADISTRMTLLQNAGEWETDLATPLIRLGLHDSDPAPDSEVEERYQKGDSSVITGVRVTAYWALIRQIQRKALSISKLLQLDVLRIVGRETGAYGAHHGLILLQAVMNAALLEQDFAAGVKAAEISIRFLDLKDRRIDEQIASLLIWWSPKLTDDYRELLKLRLSNTEAYLSMLMGRSLFISDNNAINEFSNALPALSVEQQSWAALNLWRSLYAENAPSLDSNVVRAFVDLLIREPETEKYSAVARLLAERQGESPHFAITRLLRMITTSVPKNIVFHLPFDLQLELGEAKENLVEVLEILGKHDETQFFQFVDFALSLLLQMNDGRLNARAQVAIAVLPSNAVFDSKREKWRRLISS